MALTSTHRIPTLCGAIPLVLGIGVFLSWLVVRWDWLMFAGLAVVYGGIASVVVGVIALAYDGWVAGRRTTSSRRRVVGSATACAVLLVVNVPVAAGIIWAALTIATRYTVVVRNASQARLDQVRVVEGGCNAELGSLAVGATERRSFWIRRDGVLVFRASRGADTIEQAVSSYVTGGEGGQRAVTIQQDHQIKATRRAVRELP